MTAPTLEAERAAPELAPCPFCGGTDAFVERLNYSAAYVQCDSSINEHDACLARGPIGVQEDDDEDIPGEKAAIRAWNEQAARTATPVAEGVALPPPKYPQMKMLMHGEVSECCGYTAEQVRQAQREAVAADRRARAQRVTIGDEPEFNRLIVRLLDADHAERAGQDNQYLSIRRALIAYIDGRTAGTAPADPFAAQRFLNWNRCQEKPPVAIGKELGVARKVMEFAAAPSPLHPPEEAK